MANSSSWIFWDKDRSAPGFSDGEFAWSNFGTRGRCFRFIWDGFRKQEKCNRVHPTEKPVQLYKWLLKNYAKPEFKIIDTHGGSMSSVIACYDFGIAEMICCEIDKEYFDAAVKRFENHKLQQTIKFDN
jgi:site-specific DNA-methyltransferase (adenine-specific)